MDKKKIIQWVLMIVLFFLIMQVLKPKNATAPTALTTQLLGIMAQESSYVSGKEVKVTLKNNSPAPITISSTCPANPLKVFMRSGEAFVEKQAQASITCPEKSDFTVQPNEEKIVSFSFWNHDLFGEPGHYAIEASFISGTSTQSVRSPEFTVTETGFFRKLFRTIFYQPLYNVLIFLISIAPARDLGFAIIILTIIIRLILLVPSQKAIVSQRRLQEVQPKLDKIRKEFAGNKQRIAEETMKVWKENKVNPFGSCLPLIIQFPVLIALFYVIQNGLNPDNTFLLYGSLKDFDLTSIHTNFLGILDLTRVNAYVVPILIGLLQFGQLKLAMVRKKSAEKAAEKKPEERGGKSELETANKTMTYVMPVMIAVFTASVPAGVGLYWGISTLFAIGQQLVANKK